MENATKALIIAAAILIAIVLISLGVFVLGQGSTMVQENSDMTEVQVSAYNSKWEAYFGNKVSATKAKQLINAVNTQSTTTSDDSKKVVLAGTGCITSVDSIEAGKTYKIEAESESAYHDKSTRGGYTTGGLIKYITITANNQ